MASVEVSIIVHEGPHTAAVGCFLKDWSPWISRRTGERKLYVLTITPSFQGFLITLFCSEELRGDKNEGVKLRLGKGEGKILV